MGNALTAKVVLYCPNCNKEAIETPPITTLKKKCRTCRKIMKIERIENGVDSNLYTN